MGKNLSRSYLRDYAAPIIIAAFGIYAGASLGFRGNTIASPPGQIKQRLPSNLEKKIIVEEQKPKTDDGKKKDGKNPAEPEHKIYKPDEKKPRDDYGHEWQEKMRKNYHTVLV